MARNASARRPGSPGWQRLWSDERTRGLIYQLLVILGVALFVAFIVSNTIANLQRAGLASGFGFLFDQAFFDINQRLIDYTSTSTFGRALVVGLLNTVLVSAMGIVAATAIGFVAGVLRLSPNFLLSRLVGAYVEITRNVPVLLQIIFWWVVLSGLPKVRDSLALGDAVFLNNRGVRLPAPLFESGFEWVLAAALAGVVATVFVARWS